MKKKKERWNEEGRETDGRTDCHLEKIYGGTIAAQNHSAPLPGSIPGMRGARRRDCELGRDGREGGGIN